MQYDAHLNSLWSPPFFFFLFSSSHTVLVIQSFRDHPTPFSYSSVHTFSRYHLLLVTTLPRTYLFIRCKNVLPPFLTTHAIFSVSRNESVVRTVQLASLATPLHVKCFLMPFVLGSRLGLSSCVCVLFPTPPSSCEFAHSRCGAARARQRGFPSPEVGLRG